MLMVPLVDQAGMVRVPDFATLSPPHAAGRYGPAALRGMAAFAGRRGQEAAC